MYELDADNGANNDPSQQTDSGIGFVDPPFVGRHDYHTNIVTGSSM